MQDFRRVCRLGTIPIGGSNASVFVKIEYKGGKLSITGVEGPTHGGNARGGCGQIVMSLRAEHFAAFAPGWSRATVRKLLEVWDRWHLNDMRSGVPSQEEEIRRRAKEAGEEYRNAPHAYAAKQGRKSCYNLHLAWLEEAGLVEVDGYRYGTAWKTEAVPEEVLEWLSRLPKADRAPAWV